MKTVFAKLAGTALVLAATVSAQAAPPAVAGADKGATARPAPRVQAPSTKDAEAAPTAVAVPAAKDAAFVLRGYRSATFGMTEAEVRDAIQKDYGLSGDAIKVEDNPGEQTRVFSIAVPDLLQGGGTARVAYIFGFKTKGLIQVAVQWSKATDDKITPERLFSNANILRSHFMDASYRPDTIVTNSIVNGGLLMFRGSDSLEHTTMLLLQGQLAPGDGSQRMLTPSGLLLLYMADAKNPDVFRLPSGQF
ncbi:hypothetical protein ASF22_21535 [Methylobacterium sp. Leaf87]|uniref:hypothetical protein n=1 Tax=Methylobacterium sp. Leaf87 TaxID=1736243 RepID=UPI0006FBD239|nr:hypothetical protein [Methylobacterium sp. Leaf87]KQO64194.1 hypothetical protein ASF22_21535 [Methylobacterium sp. Leaf87]